MSRSFLGIDWGTSHARVGHVVDGKVVDMEYLKDRGIKPIHKAYRDSHAVVDRLEFYLESLDSTLINRYATWPLVVSGMASSSIGITNLDYSPTPFDLDGSQLKFKRMHHGNRDLYLLSGVCSATDVMRGEETQLVGMLPLGEETIVILPGTHSKHAYVKDNRIVDFKTYMTGELFEIFRNHSTLLAATKKNESLDLEAFKSGLELSKNGQLSHQLFKVRSYQLLNHSSFDPQSMLSGVLIGYELRDVVSSNMPVLIVGTEFLSTRYEIALNYLQYPKPVKKMDGTLVDQLYLQGQLSFITQMS